MQKKPKKLEYKSQNKFVKLLLKARKKIADKVAEHLPTLTAKNPIIQGDRMTELLINWTEKQSKINRNQAEQVKIKKAQKKWKSNKRIKPPKNGI